MRTRIRSALTRSAWSAALVLAVLWPARAIGPFDGAPLDGRVEALIIGVVLPALWWLHPAFVRSCVARVLVATLLVSKLVAWIVLPQAGWCGLFLAANPATIGGFHLEPGWDARALSRSWPVECSTIVAKPYEVLADFPGWGINLPFGFYRTVDGVAHPAPLAPDPPPEGVYAMLIQGTLATARTGTLSLDVGEDVSLAGAIAGQSVTTGAGRPAIVRVESGEHDVNLRLDLTGSRWRFVPRWNGQDLFTALSTTTRSATAGERRALAASRIVAPICVTALLALWIWSAWQAWRPDRVIIGFAVAAASVACALAFIGGNWARLAALALLPAAVAQPPRRLRNGRGAWLLIGVPWLVLIAARAWPTIGRFTIYSSGDDWLTFQLYASRIFHQHYWLEGGGLFWQQPLYRWIAGAGHVIFGDSSAGEILIDGFSLLAGAMFAFHVVRRLGGFRAGLVTAVAVLLTVVIGPNWYILGRGLSEIVASGFVYLAAMYLLRARLGSVRFAAAAGVSAVLAFYTRLNHLPLVVGLASLLLPFHVSAGEALRLRSWSLTGGGRRALLAYATCLAAGVLALMTRNWYYGGEFNLFAGTTRVHNATGLGLTVDSLWSLRAWRRALESVLMIVTVQDPPRFDVRSSLVVAGVCAALLGLFRAPLARRLPLAIAVVCMAAISGGLVARGVAYPGRFSLHLIPVAVAAIGSLVAVACAAPARRVERTEAPAVA